MAFVLDYSKWNNNTCNKVGFNRAVTTKKKKKHKVAVRYYMIH